MLVVRIMLEGVLELLELDLVVDVVEFPCSIEEVSMLPAL